MLSSKANEPTFIDEKTPIQMAGCWIENLHSCRQQWRLLAELGGLLHGDIGRLRTAQNLIDKLGRAPELGQHAWPIGHQASRFDKLASKMNRRQSQSDRQDIDSILVDVDEGVAANINCVHATIERVEGGHDILGPPEFECSDLKTKHAGRRLSCAHFQHGLWVHDIDQYRQPTPRPSARSPGARMWAFCVETWRNTTSPRCVIARAVGP